MAWRKIGDHLSGEASDNGQVHVRLAGEIDLANVEAAEELVSTLIDGESRGITIDLSRVTFIGTQGVSLLLRLRSKTDAADCALSLRYPNQTVRRVLEWAEVHDAFDIQAVGDGERTARCDVRTIVIEALEQAMVEDRTDTGTAQLVDPSTGVLELVAAPGFGSTFRSFFEVVHDEEGASCAVAAANRSVQAVQDVAASPIFVGTPSLDVMIESNACACISVPVFAGRDRLVAMFSVHHDHPRDWEPERVRALQALADAAGREVDALLAS